MADRNRKEQLGARLTPGLRQRCVDAAVAAGQTLNVWVEEAILAALDIGDGSIVPPPPPIPGQTALTDFEGEPTDAGVTSAQVEGTRGSQPAPSKTFSPDCSMREYHWRCSPGNPCKRCGGET
jgi:hypothetical protein